MSTSINIWRMVITHQFDVFFHIKKSVYISKRISIYNYLLSISFKTYTVVPKDSYI